MNIKLSPKLTTSYREKFLGKQASPPKPFSYINEILLSSQKMDLTTTKQQDFKPYLKSDFLQKSQLRHRSVSPFRVNNSSTYTSNYIDFGPISKLPSQISSKPMEPVKFLGNSTYADSFKNNLKLPLILGKPPKNSNVLGATDLFLMETTTQSTYQEVREPLKSKPFVRSPLERSTGTISPSMRSTYANHFASVSPKKSRVYLEQVKD